MCGISGFISKRNISLDELKQMNDTMIHRGPDDSGVEIFAAPDGYNVGLAQRRLSILDLSPLGHQPMHSKDRRLSVVYNGEIYNFNELKKELKEYPFQSECDTEVILAAYLKWGIDCISRFNGMFAICLYDRDTQEVFLIRDRIGKKPLYYEIDGENIYFASELKPLMTRKEFQRNIRKDILSRYLYQQCINAPDTIFERVYKLEPGAVLKFSINATDPNKKYSVWKYWDVAKIYEEKQKEPVTDYREAKEELKKLFVQSVSRRMISDVPLGTFLSGGYDSSLVTAIAQSLSEKPIKTFAIGFFEERYNEAKYASKVAKYLGTDHTEMYISEKEMFDLVESIPQFYDEPFADSSQIPTMLVSALAKEQVTVALSGDGGDEFFCGYNIYKTIERARKLDFAGGIVHGFCNLPGLKQIHLQEKLPFSVRVIAGNRDPQLKTQLLNPDYMRLAEGMVPGENICCGYPIEKHYPKRNWQVKRMLLDMDTYLPGDILCKVDRASMKYSLENRCPILDKDVMEYSFRLDHTMKYMNGNKKRILKDIAYDYIDRDLLERPKVGFGVPLDKWMRGPLKEQLLSLSDTNYLKNQGLFDYEFLNRMLTGYLENGDQGPGSGANYSKIFWSFFVFQKWYEHFMSV